MRAKYSENYKERVTQVYIDYLEVGTIDYREAFNLLSEFEVLKEMSLVKTINAEIEMNKLYPAGGNWLKKLIDNVKLNYEQHLIAIASIKKDYTFLDYIQDNVKNPKTGLYKEYNELVTDPDSFWELVVKLSDLMK